MATPQDQLYHLSYGVNNLYKMLIPDNEDSLMDRLASIDKELEKIDWMQSQLALIINFWGKMTTPQDEPFKMIGTPIELENLYAQEDKRKMNKPRRDIFCFNGERPTAINLEHVTHMSVEGRRITFNFYSTSLSVDLTDENEAKVCLEKLLTIWVADVVDNQ